MRLRIKIFVGILLGVLVVGTLGFMHFEGLSFFHALYFSLVTISTVGYGDISPVSNAGKGIALLLIICGVGAFVGVVANAIELMLSARENQSRQQKLNMVIGVFFSQLGRQLLAELGKLDQSLDGVRSSFEISAAWSDVDFNKLLNAIQHYPGQIRAERDDLIQLSDLLCSERDFMLRLLENPTLMENEEFTNLLHAIFHLIEELASRDDISRSSDNDLLHMLVDVQRVYSQLISQWVVYMHYLKGSYPYLFSLAMRQNPFDLQAKAEID